MFKLLALRAPYHHSESVMLSEKLSSIRVAPGLNANGPAIKVGCVTRRQHQPGSWYPAIAGPEMCPGARRVWRIFCTRPPAKNVTNNLPLLSVLCLGLVFRSNFLRECCQGNFTFNESSQLTLNYHVKVRFLCKSHFLIKQFNIKVNLSI